MGDIVKAFNTEFKKGDTSLIEDLLDKAKTMIDEKVIQNQDVLESLQKAIKEYEKITANTVFEDSSEMTDEQIDSLKKFVSVYGKAADNLIKDTQKVEATIKDAAKGTGESLKTQLELVDDGWKRLVQRLDIQSIAQGFINLSGNIMMITSSFESLGNLPNIWHSEDLTTGEKILQTIVAVGNSLNGISQTMQLVHTTAEILNKTLFGNAGATALAAQAQKVQNEETKDAKPIQDVFQKEMIESKAAHDNVQKEIIETTQNTASNTLFWDKNTAAVRQNSAALVEQYNVRQKMNAGAKDISLEDELFGFLKEDVTENINEEAIDEVNKVVEGIKDFDIKLDNSKVEKAGKEYKETLAKTLKDEDKEIIDLFDLIDVNANDAVEGMADKIDDVIGEGLTAKDFGLADDVVENLDEATDAVENLGKAANGGGAGTAAGGIFGTLKADLGVIGKALKMIPPQAWLVAAAIGTIAVAWKVFDYYSEENVLKRNLEESTKAAEDAKKAYDDLNTSISNYTNARKNIDDLTEGTIEFYEAIISANEKAQELVDTLNLMPGYGYNFDSNGLIQIDEQVLDAALQRQLNDRYRAQAKVNYDRAALEKNNQNTIVRDFMLAVNKAAIKQGSGAKIDQTQARLILENYNNDSSTWIGEVQKTIEMGNHLGELQNQKLEDLTKTETRNSESICKEVRKGAQGTQSSIEEGGEVDISEVISEFSPQYQASQEKIDNYKFQAILQELYAYLEGEDKKHLSSLNTEDQKSITKIIDNKRKAYQNPNIEPDKQL